MTKINALHDKWMQDKSYQEAYNALEDEFALAAALIEARSRAGLTQGELAERMHTTQSAVARIEGGHIPTIRTLEKIAKATNTRLKISFEPNHAP
jgi:ribosome-binding protein aMBF1 (putative translation factor)